MEELIESPEYQDTRWDYINNRELDYLIYKELEMESIWEDQEELTKNRYHSK